MENKLLLIRYYVKKLSGELGFLWLASIFLGLSAIILNVNGILPLGKGDLLFVFLITLCVALYRPRWILFLLISSLVLENVKLGELFAGLALRTYQFLFLSLILSQIILRLSGRPTFRLPNRTRNDLFVLLLIPLSFITLFVAPDKLISLKLDVILISFIALYFLFRTAIRTNIDLLKTGAFFLSGHLIVLIFGFFQVIAQKFGTAHFEVMFGRPNSSFAEPDWLGIYLVFSFAILLSALMFSSKSKLFEAPTKLYFKLSIYFIIFLNFSLITLTLARSAWVGAGFILLLFLLLNLFEKTKEGRKLTFERFAKESGIIAGIMLVSMLIISSASLTKFDLFDRARSTATSEQKITIACEPNSNIPELVKSNGELEQYGCQHINLEEIDFHQSQGKIVTETFRSDPNVVTRSAIYQKSWQILKQNPILGVGFGTISAELGMDERGAGLNESNIFLQVWAGTGLVGLMIFIALIISLFFPSFRRLSPYCPMNYWFGCPIVRDEDERAKHVLIVLTTFAVIIPNLFNAGLFLAFFWFFLAMAVNLGEIEIN